MRHTCVLHHGKVAYATPPPFTLFQADVRMSEIKYNKSCGYHIFYFPLDVRNEAEVLKSVASMSRRRRGVQLDRTRVTRIASSILSIPGRADHHTAGFVIQVEQSARCVCVCVKDNSF